MATLIKANIESYDLLQAVKEFSQEFRTGRDLPSVQPHQVQNAMRALRKVQLQLKWWPRTREKHVDHEAFEFLAKCLEEYKAVPDHECCTASEKLYVQQLKAAGIIRRISEGYGECEL